MEGCKSNKTDNVESARSDWSVLGPCFTNYIWLSLRLTFVIIRARSYFGSALYFGSLKNDAYTVKKVEVRRYEIQKKKRLSLDVGVNVPRKGRWPSLNLQ